MNKKIINISIFCAIILFCVAFVFAIVDVSHELGTPVLLISHKPWWHKLAKSIIHVSRTAKEMTEDQNYSFQIKLTLKD